MKIRIIADNKEEFDNIVEASKYLHDHHWTKGKHTYSLDQDKYPIIGLLAHLYLVKYLGKKNSDGQSAAAIHKFFHIKKKPKKKNT